MEIIKLKNTTTGKKPCQMDSTVKWRRQRIEMMNLKNGQQNLLNLNKQKAD